MLRSMYIWKLDVVLSAEGGVNRIIEKAKRAKLSSLWIKVADGASDFANTKGKIGNQLTALVTRAHANDIEVWGWQVPHCADLGAAQAEASTFEQLAQKFKLDGLIMDAEGGGTFFQGGVAEAAAYASAMKQVAAGLGKPLAISSNDIPQNLAGWLPRFAQIASVCDFNFPQAYYGASPSVTNRIDRAAAANSQVKAPFLPVGAAFIGTSEGGCPSASACAADARDLINLCHDRDYKGYSFWHWGGAPLPFWDVLNSTPV